MRWRLSYRAGAGFQRVVQPKRQSRREYKDAAEADDVWPDSREAWRILREWQSQASTQETEETLALRLPDLVRSIQVSEDLVNSCKNETTFRVKVTDFIDSTLPPGEAMCSALNRHISDESNNPFLSPARLESAIGPSAEQDSASVSPSADALSGLPLEILDLIVNDCVEINLGLVAFVKQPGSPSPKCYGFTPSERAALQDMPKKAWLYISSIPLFHTSRLLRDRIVAVIRRRIRDAGGTFSPQTWLAHGRASLRLVPSDDSKRFTKPLGVGLRAQGDQPRRLRDISHHLWGLITRLDIVAVWAFRTKRLTTPLKRLIGFEGIFHALCHISVRCRVVGFDPNESTAVDRAHSEGDRWQSLVDALYEPRGAYEQIAEEIGKAIDISIWGALTGRTGIWPGYCLRPTCTPDEVRPCLARLPMLSHRMPIIDIELLPEL